MLCQLVSELRSFLEKMPPRRQGNQHRTTVDEIYSRDDLDRRIGQIIDERLDQRIGQIIDRRLDAVVAQITERLEALAPNQNQGRNPNPNLGPNIGFEGAHDDISYVDEVNYDDLPQRRRGRPRVEEDRRRWETGMRTEIPEFHGTLQAEEFMDWLATVEEILEFKGVPDDMRVQLVATRLRGRATAWWQQTKLTRSRLGKSKIVTWEKMKKHLRATFLPYNFQRIMYQKLQNLKQGR